MVQPRSTDQPASRSPANVEKHLQGVDYPATRDDLEQAARNNQAPEEVLQEIRNLPEERYARATDVTKSFARDRPRT